MKYNAIAKEGHEFVLTKEGYDATPDKIKKERAIGKPVKGFENKCPTSWVQKGYVVES